MPPPSPTTRPRLTTLVTVGVSATVLLTVLALLILVDHFAIDYARREAEQRLQQLSWQMRDALNGVVRKAAGDVQLLSELPRIREGRSPAEVRQVLESLQKTFPDYAWIGLATVDGKVFAATQGVQEGVDISARDWFKAGRQKINAADYPPTTLPGTKLPYNADPWRFVDASGPVLGADGQLRGVLCVRMSWGWARRMVQTVFAPASQQYSADIFVVRSDGVAILGPQGMEDKTIRSDSMELAANGANGALKETWADGRDYLTGYARTGTPGDPATLSWTILVRQPESLALSGARALEHQILLLGAILGAVMALGAAALAGRLTRPLNALSRAIEDRLAAPPDAATLPDVRQTDSYHEVQVLSRALNDMLRTEQQHLDALRGMNERLESTVAERTREIARKALQLERALAQEHTTQQLLQERAAELRAILDNAHDAFIALDPGGVVREWNLQAECLLGWKRTEVIGQPLAAMLLPPLLRRAYERDMRQLADSSDGAAPVLSRRVELMLHNRSGQELPVEVSLAYVPRSSGHLFIAFLHDISERKSLFASMEAMALNDTLTGLPNRRALMQALPEALQRANRLRQSCAVFFLDLDRFKQVNDRYGHEEGDELLRQFAQRVRGAVRKTDTVGRLAGDEFVVILEMLHSDADAQEAADKLLPALQQPFVLKTTTVSLSASIGIAIHHPDDPQDIEVLLGRADRAMYRHKQHGMQQRARR
ncbi:PAS domain S-box-containing protein/diguanylate cyclase (GGDEF) domain-containing protein [Duganella sp. CF402]|uniref:diguanylate cyclase domain-containing protein n=1 Tax=unclassified Duganella TaxID=2636909 RepID=UPI0008BB9189|nr:MULTISPECIES: diguanylate cyclase [unclassified Duganella]RZT09275.1 PAS domain S-box-containing protein/diguanylate cyclase (GGDEF)-like protein [Duganella sp. BK701]SEL63711.1 PAS domain S-box-containing protein/diguanylate cyclase (GGDEF) domain-containing protein [Duganella sp. CF402]